METKFGVIVENRDLYCVSHDARQRSCCWVDKILAWQYSADEDGSTIIPIVFCDGISESNDYYCLIGSKEECEKYVKENFQEYKKVE